VQELHRGGVPECVQRDFLLAQALLVLGGVREVDREASFERVAGQPSAADRREQRVVGVAGAFGEPDADHRAGCPRERRDPLLASFPFARHVCGAGDLNVVDVERGQLGCA
jgi:hypothetical protein